MKSILKGIKRLVNYGIILIGFSLFVGCDNPTAPVLILETEDEDLSSLVFELNSNMYVDENGFHHLTLDTSKWQTPHRVSGNVYRDDNAVNVIKFIWHSTHHWIIGDDFGYFINNTGLNDNGTYVGYDTTFVDWFEGYTVPIVNGSSYSNMDGEVNVMLAPTRNMVGDTATIHYGFFDNWKEEEIYGNFNVIFD